MLHQACVYLEQLNFVERTLDGRILCVPAAIEMLQMKAIHQRHVWNNRASYLQSTCSTRTTLPTIVLLLKSQHSESVPPLNMQHSIVPLRNMQHSKSVGAC